MSSPIDGERVKYILDNGYNMDATRIFNNFYTDGKYSQAAVKYIKDNGSPYNLYEVLSEYIEVGGLGPTGKIKGNADQLHNDIKELYLRVRTPNSAIGMNGSTWLGGKGKSRTRKSRKSRKSRTRKNRKI